MKTYKVYAQYSVYGAIHIEAENEETLKKQLNNKNFLINLKLPEKTEYLEDSFEVDLETITEV